MSKIKVSSKYAFSLLNIAIKKNILNIIYKDIKLLNNICKSNLNFLLMLKNPFINNIKKNKILYNIFKNKVDNLILSFLNLLIFKNRQMLLFDIINFFLLEYNKYYFIKNVKIITTFKLSEILKNSFKNIIKKISFCKKINLIEYINSSLIGGYILSIDDKRIDESIKNKLNLLKLNFKN